MTAALEGGEWSAARPGRTLPPGKTRYPFYSRLGGPQGQSGRAENLVPTGIRSRTVQPVAQSLYRLSYRAHLYYCSELNYLIYVRVIVVTDLYRCVRNHELLCFSGNVMDLQFHILHPAPTFALRRLNIECPGFWFLKK